MPRSDQSLRIGDIVEIIDPDNEGLALRGEVRDVGPPLKVAFTYLETFKPNQVRKVDALSTLTWNELRARAKELGVPAVGKRDELEAAVEANISQAAPPTVPAARSRGAEADDFPVGALVQINDPPDQLRHNCRGKVIEGPSVNVRLTNKNFEVEDKVYPKKKLIRVG